MKLINKILQNFDLKLFYLIIFLIPSQLALHIWPNYSYVYGLKIDYLSIAIYLTDILIFCYIFNFLIKTKVEKLFKFSKSFYLKIIALSAVIIINIFNASIWQLALFKWIKIIELILFSFAIKKNKNIEGYKVFRTLCYSILLFGFIGIAQFIKGKTLGGLFYYLGERTFSSITPGISLLGIFNKLFLKPYSTFSHPNSFAGYISVIAIYLLFWKENKTNKLIKYLALVLIFILLILTYSKAAILSLVLIAILSAMKLIKKPIIKTLLYVLIVLSLLTPLISVFLINGNYYFPSYVSERLVLSELAGNMLSSNFIFGIGANNFISYIPMLHSIRISFWFLQPVHNIVLLLIVETGIVGLGIIFFIFSNYVNYLFDNKKVVYIVILLMILMTGFFDHYWYTLQQNLVLVFVFLGLSKNENIK